MSERVTMIVADGIADVRLNRPEKINALDRAQFEAIAGAIDRLAAMPNLRCVVLSGEGRGFCAGVDLDSLAADQAAARSRPAHAWRCQFCPACGLWLARACRCR